MPEQECRFGEALGHSVHLYASELTLYHSLLASARLASRSSHSSCKAFNWPAAWARKPGSLAVAMLLASRTASAMRSCRVSMMARTPAGAWSRLKAKAPDMSKSSGFVYMSIGTCLGRVLIVRCIVFG